MPNTHTLIVQPDDGRTLLLRLIGAARQTIDLFIYEITDSQVVSALVAAAHSGVKVRIIYNWHSFTPRRQQSDVMPTITALTKAGIACQQANKKYEVTHAKTMVIDGTTGIVMSFNLTADYFGQTRDFGIVTTNAVEVMEIAAVFAADWANQPTAPKVASLVWSPENSRNRLTTLIANAKSTLDVYCEEVEDPGTLAALVTAKERGVAVRFIAAVLSGSGKVNGNARGITYLRSAGINAVCKTFLYIHAKMILADVGQGGSSAYVGSENLSCTSLNSNRECGIIFADPDLLSRLQAIYNGDWAQPSVTVVPDETPLQPCSSG